MNQPLFDFDLKRVSRTHYITGKAAINFPDPGSTTGGWHFLSYFDPVSDAEMSVTAPRIPAKTAVMTVIGEKDPMFKFIKGYYVDKLPANPKSKYLEVSGGHLDTPRVSSDEVIAWIKTAVAP